MQRGDDGAAALAGEAADHVEEARFLAEVEVGGRLVEEEERRALREAARDGDAAALAAGERVDAALGEGDEVGGGERVGDGGVVDRGGTAPRGEVGEATERDDLADAEGRFDGVVLGGRRRRGGPRRGRRAWRGRGRRR